MKLYPAGACLTTLVLMISLTACSSHTQDNTAVTTTSDSDSSITGQVREGIEEAKRELEQKDIDLGKLHVGRGHFIALGVSPKAVITPAGDLLIAGKTVPATPEQHALLLGYRQQLIDIAEAGMDIGESGAALGINAAKDALWGALGGKSDKDIEANIKPQTDQIEAAALGLCKRLPGLLAAQQRLAVSIPAFAPYATLQQTDIDDCGKQMTDKNGKKGFAVFSD